MNFYLKRIKRAGCPNCGHSYFKLYQTARSICPLCHINICTDIWMVRAIETIIVAPIFWLLLTALRLSLNDSTGILSCLLLMIPAKISDILVAQRFVTVYRANEELGKPE